MQASRSTAANDDRSREGERQEDEGERSSAFQDERPREGRREKKKTTVSLVFMLPVVIVFVSVCLSVCLSQEIQFSKFFSLVSLHRLFSSLCSLSVFFSLSLLFSLPLSSPAPSRFVVPGLPLQPLDTFRIRHTFQQAAQNHCSA